MEKEKLLENFVYLLFDPDETKPFYVGKGKNKIDFEKVSKSLKNLREQINLIVTIRENMSKAESDITDARHNVDKLEKNLVRNIEKLENTYTAEK